MCLKRLLDHDNKGLPLPQPSDSMSKVVEFDDSNEIETMYLKVAMMLGVHSAPKRLHIAQCRD